jgi:hypothetical protein
VQTPVDPERQRELNLQYANCYIQSDEEGEKKKKKKKRKKKKKKQRKRARKLERKRARKMLSDASDSSDEESDTTQRMRKKRKMFSLADHEFCPSESVSDSWDDSYECRHCEQTVLKRTPAPPVLKHSAGKNLSDASHSSDEDSASAKLQRQMQKVLGQMQKKEEELKR